ncbi:MAG: SUMF1/EgtB/PvdO family nonheme iron enzyme [Planctomycetota bacterium]
MRRVAFLYASIIGFCVAAVPTTPSWSKGGATPVDQNGYYTAILELGGRDVTMVHVPAADRTVRMGTRVHSSPPDAHGQRRRLYDGLERPQSGVRWFELTETAMASEWSDAPPKAGAPPADRDAAIAAPVNDVLQVGFSRNFWMCQDEVDMALWAAVMGGGRPNAWPADNLNAYGYADYTWDDAASRPVVFVDDAAVQSFLTAAGVGAQLPTEAEWILCARAGGELPFGQRWEPYDMDVQEHGGNSVLLSGYESIVASASGSNLVKRNPGTGEITAGEYFTVGLQRPAAYLPDALRPYTYRFTYYTYEAPAVFDWRFAYPDRFIHIDPPQRPRRLDHLDWEAQGEYRMVTDYDNNSYLTTVTGPGAWEKKNFVSIQSVSYQLGKPDATTNPWGFRNLFGNVAEMVRDHWDGRSGYSTHGAAMTDVLNNQPGDRYRLVKGGSWRSPASALRCAARAKLLRMTHAVGLSVPSGMNNTPQCVSDTVGFRFIIYE